MNKEKVKTKTNFEAIHKQLEKTRSLVEGGFTPPLEEIKRILKERAKILAKSKDEVKTEVEKLEILQFELGSENYGIESKYVKAVYPLKHLTLVPCTPSFVLGVINVRGKIISVVDLKKIFNLPQKGLVDRNRIIIIEYKDMEVGVLTDVIVGTRLVLKNDIEESFPTLTGKKREFLKGVTKDQMAILNVEKLLTDKSIVVNDEVVNV